MKLEYCRSVNLKPGRERAMSDKQNFTPIFKGPKIKFYSLEVNLSLSFP